MDIEQEFTRIMDREFAVHTMDIVREIFPNFNLSQKKRVMRVHKKLKKKGYITTVDIEIPYLKVNLLNSLFSNPKTNTKKYG
jgi:hypothetical protein